MAELDVFQSMWGMEQHRPDGFEWSTEEKITKIANAGFKGVSFDMPYHSYDYLKEAEPFLNQHNLDVVINAFLDSTKSYENLLAHLQGFSRPIRFVGIIGQIEPWDLNEVATQTRQWLELGEQAGMPTHVEIHRNCMTNDFLFTMQLLEKVPKLRMVADLSHALVNQEWYLPINARARYLLSKFLARTEAFHGRVGTREQAQVSFEFPQHQPWYEQFQAWWREGFSYWQQRYANHAEARCVFLCELGPPPYAITGADGYELSDRWQQAIELKAMAERLWLEAEQMDSAA